MEPEYFSKLKEKPQYALIIAQRSIDLEALRTDFSNNAGNNYSPEGKELAAAIILADEKLLDEAINLGLTKEKLHRRMEAAHL
ncbi:MAG: hypothetical protein AABW73_00690 [Nanoarchaeota archaeon]